jgi:dipeptide transport system permease protein
VIRFVVLRLLQLVGVLLAVSAIVFFALRLGPFDPAGQIAEATLGDPARIAELEAYWGLDQPLPAQYGKYLTGLVHGDLGTSLQDLQPVSVAILDRLPATIELAVVSMLIGTVLGVAVGIFAAYRRDSWLDVGGRSMALVGTSFPTFWLGVMAIAVFSVKLQWLPAGGRFSEELAFEPTTGFYILDGILQRRLDVVANALEHLLLPATVLGLLVSGLVTRITRSAMLEELGKDYVRTALAKGSPPARAAVRHALANALLPIVTIVGLLFGLLLSGAVIVETVFAFPGMGKLLVDSISVRDFPQVQACILVLAAIYSLVNATADVLYGVIDPRVRVS